MREEVFRLEQVSIPPLLHDIHMHLYRGEIVALIGLNALGIDELLEIFQKNIALHYGHVYCKNALVNDYLGSNHSLNPVTVIERNCMLIDTMSVEDNLFILRKKSKQHIIRGKMLGKQMQALLEPIGLSIEPKTLVKDISSFEKLVIQFLKASLARSVLVILRDISTFVSEIDLARLKPILTYLSRERGMSFLYVCNHHQEAFHFASRCYLMREGRIIKHLYADQMTDAIINCYANEFAESVELSDRQQQYGLQNKSEDLLALKHLMYGNINNLNFVVHHLETVVLLDSENLVIHQLFDLLGKNYLDYGGTIEYRGKPMPSSSRAIALVPPKPDVSLIFPQLSVLDNLLFTSDHKISNLWFNMHRRSALARELEQKFGENLAEKNPADFDMAYRLRLVYQRLLLQKPEFLCVVQPFASIDMYQRMEIISYFDLFKQRGTSILILAVSLSDSLQIADRLVILKEGTVQRQLFRSEFSQYHGIVGSIPLQPKE